MLTRRSLFRSLLTVPFFGHSLCGWGVGRNLLPERTAKEFRIGDHQEDDGYWRLFSIDPAMAGPMPVAFAYPGPGKTVITSGQSRKVIDAYWARIDGQFYRIKRVYFSHVYDNFIAVVDYGLEN